MTTDTKDFTCSLGTKIQVITVLCWVIMIAPGAVLLIAGGFMALHDWVPGALMGGLGLFVLGSCMLLGAYLRASAPKRYDVTPAGIEIIRYHRKSIILPHANIAAVEAIERNRLKGSIRTFGSGGFMGCFGYFWNKQLGNYEAYMTRLDSMVLVRFKTASAYSAACVLSPDDRDGFLASVNAMLTA